MPAGPAQAEEQGVCDSAGAASSARSTGGGAAGAARPADGDERTAAAAGPACPAVTRSACNPARAAVATKA
ncbi:hypothetical protein I545_1472 [Mycobacterium kansasii 662]|uniref:Uncharacterized protein n=2 Tax=Mycobacterium kansasii TaxID=1768 RepID=U5WZV0_MYCKA|nr:hypothetical protein MKAN_26340 [Mycobacterium kansasii ATCC 12478]EUA20946.1 hypothetical protein I545_1472 [Mycobacterium kansasii 662]